MNQADEKLIDSIVEPTYDLEIWLSTDGKHTVKTHSQTPEGHKKAYSVATSVYDQIVAKYGTKQAQAVKEYSKDNGGTVGHPTTPEKPIVTTTEFLGVCTKCGAPNKMSASGKPYCSKVCWKK